MPDLAIIELDTSGFDPRDAALAHAIYDAVITRWMTLSYIVGKVGRVTMSELEPRMQAVLLGGAAQLLLMDRIPVHAVLDESVQWAKDHIRAGAGGMTNAILRKVARVRGEKTETWDNEMDRIPLSDGGGLELVGMELPEDSRRRLSVSCSLPLDLLRDWFEMYGPPRAQALHTLCRAPVVVYTGAASALDEEHLGAHESATSRVFTGGRRQLLDLLEDRDDLWVQDAASSASVESIPECSPSLIIDLCAGQGTKTRQLLARYPDAEVWACEVDDTRLDTLSSVFRHDDRVQVLHVEDLVDAPRKADLVLADVPCSNSGVLARRPEARYRPMEDQLARITPLQREIVRNAVGMLEPGGILVYATCSLERAENEDQSAWILDAFPATLLNQSRVDPKGLPGEDAGRYWDGSFCAAFRVG
ncbi:MAG: hypothetical protein KC996_06675 [Phycisphaerales bacterium]|nr:hypothetical protein [Phycisphaerales bacterium]